MVAVGVSIEREPGVVELIELGKQLAAFVPNLNRRFFGLEGGGGSRISFSLTFSEGEGIQLAEGERESIGWVVSAILGTTI